MKVLVAVLVILITLLQYQLWVSPSGIRQTINLEKRVTELKAQNQQLQQRNAVLQADVNDLKKGQQAAEERARNDMGMVKKGETFYQIISK